MTSTDKNYIFWKVGVLIFACVFFVSPFVARAYVIEALPDDVVRSDFVVGPGKQELEIKPGESKTVNITVSNRMGDTRIFNLDTEDFTGSKSTEDTVILLGEDSGPYSLKDFISFPEPSFELRHAQRAIVPVTIFVPADAAPGGLYGSVLVSTASKPGESKGPSSAIVTRIGTLFFVRVPGDVTEEGKLTQFQTKEAQKIYGAGPVTFELLYENNGSVHLNPSGEISIKNILGKEIGKVDVEPWFAMPDSLRLREVNWESGFLLGKYTAVASIYRGYDNIVDTMEFSFWVIPIKLLVLVCVVMVILLFVIRFIVTRFEIKMKR